MSNIGLSWELRPRSGWRAFCVKERRHDSGDATSKKRDKEATQLEAVVRRFLLP